MKQPTPPFPDLVRKPVKGFGWLDACLLHDGWLSRIETKALSLLVFLAIAADRRGASFYGRDRMASRLAFSRDDVDRALAQLTDVGLLAFRPWRDGCCDGVWQLLPVPREQPSERSGECMAVGDILKRLGKQH